MESADINEFVEQHAGPETRSYTTVPLDKELGNYRVLIYPTSDAEEAFTTSKPWVYALVVVAVFVLTCSLLYILDRVVAQRQRLVIARVVKAAKDSSAYEHNLNGFIAHEVRK